MSDTIEPIELSEEEWKRRLTPEQYRIARQKGTEPAFSGKYWDSKTAGTYSCVACGLELFDSEAKYDSGSGWPSFTRPVAQDHVEDERDASYGMLRTEVLCSRCGSHLGHVFPDGPGSSGQRYCINSGALQLEERED